MYKTRFIHRLLIFFLVIFAYPALAADDLQQMSRGELVDQWGQLLFCRFISIPACRDYCAALIKNPEPAGE